MTGPNVEFAHQRRCSVLKSSGRGGRILHGKCLPRGDFFPVQILRGETFPGGGPMTGNLV